jgi:predicted enzyme related to lactoylglutathione lyase
MSHAHGTFCFAELHTHDLAAARQFYGAVLGWTAVELPGASGGYSLFQVDGQDVAGLRRAQGPTRWIPYLAVTRADETAARAQELHAGIVSAPADLHGLARTAILHDPAGGVVGLWEARGRQGAALIDAPGSLWWTELVTRDFASAKSFYASLLGWRAVDTLKYGIRYSVFKRGDESVAGLLPIGADWGPSGHYWQVLFAVDDCDARVERVTRAGGAVVFGPRDIPNAGRAAVVTDPQHAVFVVMQPAG